jgi:uncharacterized membrane protein
MVSRKCGRVFLAVFIVCLGLLVAQWPCFASDEDKKAAEKKPARAIVMAAQYPGEENSKDEDLSMDIIFHNKGRKDEDVSVWISEKPKGWQAKIKTYRFTVTGIHVPSGDDRSLTFEADPGERVKPGEYTNFV